MTDTPLITEEHVRDLASPASLERGEYYLAAGALSALQRAGNRISALCRGSRRKPYRVTATLAPGGLASASCSCPYDWGGICKHLVALLLRYARDPESFDSEAQGEAETLRSLSHEELVELVLRLLSHEPRLRRLLPRPRRSTPVDFDGDLSPLAAPAREALEEAEEIEDISEAVVEIGDLLEEALDRADEEEDPTAAIAEATAILEVMDQARVQDYDYNGELGALAENWSHALVDRVEEVDWPRVRRHAWIRRCLRNEETHCGSVYWVSLARAVERDDEDRRLVETEIRRHVSQPREGQRGGSSDSQWLEHLLCLLAEQGRDRDLEEICWEQGEPEHYVRYLLRSRRPGEAARYAAEHLASARQLLAVAKDVAGQQAEDEAQSLTRLVLEREDLTGVLKAEALDLLTSLVERRGEASEARRAAEESFLIRPSLKGFRRVLDLSERLGDREQRARDLLSQLEKGPFGSDNGSVLAELHLEAGNLTRALELVRQAPYGFPSTVERVAEAAEEEHPQEAIALYQRLAEKAIQGSSRQSYAAAAVYLRRAGTVAEKAGLEGAFRAYVAALRQEHSRRRALLEELAGV